MGAMGTIVKHLKMPDDAPYRQEMEVSEDFEEVSDREEKASDRYQKVSEDAWETDYNIPKMPDWEHKALSKATFDMKIEPFPILGTFSLGGVAVLGTVQGADPRMQVMMYISTAMLFVITNPLHAVERFLALPSRFMVAAVLLMIDLLISFPTRNMILATMIVTLILMTFVMIGNKSWLIRETYLATEFTRKSQDTESEDLPFLSWRAHGKRELWTTLEQAGLTVTENELNFGYRIAWRLGYYSGMTMVESKNGYIDDLKSTIEDLSEELETKNSELEKIAWWTQNYKEMDSEIADLKVQLKEAQEETDYYQLQLDDHEDLERRLNDELQKKEKQLQEYKTDGNDHEHEEELVKRMLEAGISYRKIEAVTGWNKYKTGEVKDKYGIELKRKQED